MWKYGLKEAQGPVLSSFHCSDESLRCVSRVLCWPAEQQLVACSRRSLLRKVSHTGQLGTHTWLMLTNQTIKFLLCDVWVCACVRVQKQQDTCSEMGDRRSDYVSCAAPQSLPTAVRAEKGRETLVHERCKWTGTVWVGERPFSVQIFPYTFLIH